MNGQRSRAESRRRIARRRKIKKAIKEAVGSALIGVLMGGMLIWAFINDPYEPPKPPEHFGQVQYGGIWWDQEDYEQMMEEREQYLKEEQAQEQEFINAVRNVQAQQETAAETTSQTLIGSLDWDAEESYMLAKIAMAEAEGEDTEGKALVILVVLNRVWSDGFPDSIEEVIMEPGQFSPVREGGRYYTTVPDEDCWEALSLVMHGWDESQGATYFTSSEEHDTWHSRNLTELFEHGNHIFYKEGQGA